MKEVQVKLLVSILAIASIPLLFIEQGWAISTLWGWFLVPLGVPAIGIAASIGIAITLSVLVSRYRKTDDDDKWGVLLYAFVRPLVLVFIGWIVKQFV